jgi:hypothetical protein
VDYEYEYVYKPGHTTLLPRMYSPDPKHREAYRKWMGLAENRKPTMMQNLGFMFSYQLNHMYWRYFLWNFAGRESSIQGAGWLGPADWFGSFLPEQIRKNTAHNNYYCLPLLLGLLGLYFHVRKDPKGASLAMLLFFFTGIAIVLYLNQPPVEPRERDYTFVGSFYAFSIWIGIGVLYLTDISGRIIRSEWLRGGLAAACGLLVPLTMLAVNLDDHDRRGRYLALDSARNLLAGCEPNSILFTAADNDTFPLWYIQEVEEFRTDVRICNLSLLQSDSYISAMKRRSNLSAPLPISLEFKDFRQSRNDQVVIWENPEYKSGLSLKRFMEMIRAEDERVFYPAGDDRITVLPTKELCLPVDREKVKASCVKDPALQPYITDTMRLSIDKNFLKAELIVLDIIAHNNWERAVYFDHTASMDYPYLKKYFQQEGTFFRLMPLAPPRAENGWVNSAASYRNLIERSVWRGLDNPAINHDPAGMPFISACRIEHYSLAVQLYNEGKAGRALNVLKHSLEKMPDESMPYDYSVLNYPPLLYALGERERAAKVCRIFGERSGQFLEYLSSQNKRNTDDYREHQYILNHVVSILREAGENEPAAGFERILNAHR